MVEIPVTHAAGVRVERFTDDAGRFRWRVVAEANGEIMADSAEGDGYTDARDRDHGWQKVLGLAQHPDTALWVRGVLSEDRVIWQAVRVVTLDRQVRQD